MKTKLYGISNCSTVKKARVFLEHHAVDFDFIDFKKQAPQAADIQAWLEHIPLEILLNKRGTTWRNLGDEDKKQADAPAGAIALMQAHPSLIKRPVLVSSQLTSVGFKEDDYQQFLAAGQL